MFQGCIFDLDGTLINSLDDLADTCNQILNQHGLPIYPTQCYKQFVGDGIYKLIQRILPTEMADKETIDLYKTYFDTAYQNNYHNKSLPYPGIIKLLLQLRRQKIKLAVVSNKPAPFTKKIVSEFFPAGSFDAVIGQDDNVPKKPDSTGTLLAVKQMELIPEQCLFIGDSNVDIFTGKNAGIKTCGVLWGFRGQEELQAAGANFLVSSPAQIEKIIFSTDSRK